MCDFLFMYESFVFWGYMKCECFVVEVVGCVSGML